MLQPTKVNKFFFEGYMKLQLKLMALTLALFSFVNAAQDGVTDDALVASRKAQGSPLASKESEKLVESLLPKEKSKENSDVRDVELRNKLTRACHDMGSALWGYIRPGTPLRDLKRGCDWTFSDEHLQQAAVLYNAGKDKAWSLLERVRRNVPVPALATAGLFFVDSVSTELVCESSIYALALGGGLCYVSSRFKLVGSKKPAGNLLFEHRKEELARLCALKEKLCKHDSEEDDAKEKLSAVVESGSEDDFSGSEDEEKRGKEKKEKDHAASDASAGHGAKEKVIDDHEHDEHK